MKSPSQTLLVLFVVLFSPYISAEVLTERGVYERCYAKLIRQTPLADDPFVPAIEAGTLTGAVACKNLFNLALFNGSGRLLPYTTEPAKLELAKRVLQSLNELHASWLHVKKYVAANGCFDQVTNGLVDPQEPALHFTRALFHPGFSLTHAVTSRDYIRAERSVNNPTYTIFNINLLTPIEGFPATTRFIDHGAMTGVMTAASPAVGPLTALRTYAGQPNTLATAPVLANAGGGILGSQAYLLNNLAENPMMPDLESLPRNWSKYVIKDLLCRELPVITAADADPYQVCSAADCAIKPTAAQAPSVLSFRRDLACVQCHATMDQLAGLVRNQRFYRTGACRNQAPESRASHHFVEFNSTLAAGGWGFLKDADYHKREANGRFLYRTHNNTLINQPVNNLADLGTLISGMDDYYICAAKRYYRYFTGVDVDLSPMTATQVAALPPDRRFYRNRVVNLGLQLKSTAVSGFNREPAKLIEAIFALPEYKQRDLDLARKAQP